MENMNIEILKDHGHLEGFYYVKLNGEVILECLSEREIKETTIEDILKCLEY